MSKWQPIDTAPRDGTPIYVRLHYGLDPSYGTFSWRDSGGPDGMVWVNIPDVPTEYLTYIDERDVGRLRLSWKPLAH